MSIFYINININNKNIRFKRNKFSYYILKRTMFSRSYFASQKLLTKGVMRSYTESVHKLKKTAVTKLAADDSGKHPHHLKNICAKDDCEQKLCQKQCDTPKEVQTAGFFTHKPIAGKFTRFLSDEDHCGGNAQYYAKTPKGTRQVPAQEAQTMQANKEISTNISQIESYMKRSDISIKLNE